MSAPQSVDERNWLALHRMAERVVLRGEPEGDERCEGCTYYLDPDEALSYCWNPQLRILVGAGWWCRWWEHSPRVAG